MAAPLALWPNAHRERQLAELLSEHVCSVMGLVGELGVSANDVEHIVARLRSNGLPVATVDVGDEDPLYRVLYPAGRVCASECCRTILRRSNPADTCELHGGGFLTVTQRAPARPEPSRVDWRGLRELWGLSQAEWARRAKVNAGFLSHIERGLQRPSQDVARRLFGALPMRR
jgi:DNA-binding XRE family transcriptional regulator